jgi:hypothetical protein
MVLSIFALGLGSRVATLNSQLRDGKFPSMNMTVFVLFQKLLDKGLKGNGL